MNNDTFKMLFDQWHEYYTKYMPIALKKHEKLMYNDSTVREETRQHAFNSMRMVHGEALFNEFYQEYHQRQETIQKVELAKLEPPFEEKMPKVGDMIECVGQDSTNRRLNFTQGELYEVKVVERDKSKRVVCWIIDNFRFLTPVFLYDVHTGKHVFEVVEPNEL